MKKKKPSSRKNKRNNALVSLAGSAYRHLFTGALTTPVLLVLLILAGFLIIEWLTGEARKLPEYKVFPQEVRCIGRPAWLASSDRLTAQVLEEIQTHIRQLPPRPIFDKELEELLRTDPASFSPWIESVETFEPIYPSRYRVELKMRKPVAVFLHNRRSYFIDGMGVVIAGVGQVDMGRVEALIPQVTGFGETHAIQAGRATINRRLIEGAAVAREIEALQDWPGTAALRIQRIDVSRFGGGRPEDVALVTDQGARILWGRSALNAQFEGIDPTPEMKAVQLEEVLKVRPGLSGLKEVKLTFDKAFCTPLDS